MVALPAPPVADGELVERVPASEDASAVSVSVVSRTRASSLAISAPSLGRYAMPTGALEDAEQRAVRVAEAGFELHAPRLRPAAADPTGIGSAVDVPSGVPDSRDVNIHT